MRIVFWFLGLFLFSASIFGQGEPLNIAVDNFSPPFVMRGANNTFYGFDIELMQNLCTTINRTCKFIPMPFKDLIPGVEAKKYDVAVSAITITPERAAVVNFTTPYMISQCRFLGTKDLATQPFSLAMLNDKSIGVEQGTVFSQVLQNLGVKAANIKTYDSLNSILEDMVAGNLDAALLDGPTAQYWSSDSSNSLTVLGSPFTYGYGFGIAVNKENSVLLQQLNDAITKYQNSEQYKKDYDRYFANF